MRAVIVEHGTLEDIFNHTPPSVYRGPVQLPAEPGEPAGSELKPIKGLMPDPSNLPKGCAFCPRCEYAMEICKTQKPPSAYTGTSSHYVECHLYNEDEYP